MRGFALRPFLWRVCSNTAVSLKICDRILWVVICEIYGSLEQHDQQRGNLAGRYQIVKPLGGGGFGQTFLARDLQHQLRASRNLQTHEPTLS